MTEFEELFNENREFIFKYLMKMTRDSSLSEELTQETFFRAYMNYASLRNKEKVSVWLCQIAKNTYFAWYNEHKKKTSLDVLETAVTDESIEDAFVQKELSSKALRCLHDLEEPYKDEVTTDFYDDLLVYFAAALVALLFLEWFLHSRKER